MKQFLSGNEAIARGAYEAGVSVAAAYPGTPSTEVLESLIHYKDEIYCEWSVSEKVAAEVAIGASIAGGRAVAIMKHVGVNVAADPFFSYAYTGTGGGFVLVTGDDPGLMSSHNEQDNRYYAKFAKVPMIEPSDSQECKDFIIEAFKISEQYGAPVLLRMTTRLCHSRSSVTLGERDGTHFKPYTKDPNRFVVIPQNAKTNRLKLEQRLKALSAYSETSPLNKTEYHDTAIGIITAGMAYQYAKEVFGENASYLKLGFTYPLPMNMIREFASKVEVLYIIEELEPFMEEQIKAAGIHCVGKEKLSNIYELSPDIIAEALLGKKPKYKAQDFKTPERLPTLCPGCPYRGFYYTLAQKKAVVAGDVGCNTLGVTPPLQAIDTCICMGAGVSTAVGMARAFKAAGKGVRVFGLMGDGGLYHSGLQGIIDALYTNTPVITVILDNKTIAMSGHQKNPGSGKNTMGELIKPIDTIALLKAIGFRNIAIADPYDLHAVNTVIEDALKHEEPYAIVIARPCMFVKSNLPPKAPCTVSKDKCKGCQKCIQVGCPALYMKEKTAYIDPAACTGCQVCAQVCPFQAIEKAGEV